MTGISGDQRGAPRASGDGPLTFAAKLGRLFRAAGNPRLEKVAQAILERGGPTLSASSLWLLRTGQKDHPTLKHLEAIAGYFHVPPAYFFDDALTGQDAADLELVAALRDPDVRALALRARTLSLLGRQALSELAVQLAQIEAQAGALRTAGAPRRSGGAT